MEWLFLLFCGVTLAIVGLIVYFGLKLNKVVLKRASEIGFPVYVTLTGTALMACAVGFWILCLVARNLTPDSSFGAFVRTTDGLVAAFLGSIVFLAIAAGILEKLGYPIARKGE
jgi:hypothetical protein